MSSLDTYIFPEYIVLYTLIDMSSRNITYLGKD